MRNRSRASDRPRRLFEDVNTVARGAGLLRGRRRVLDSTPLHDAVATQDAVTQLRATIRKLLSLLQGVLARAVEWGRIQSNPDRLPAARSQRGCLPGPRIEGVAYCTAQVLPKANSSPSGSLPRR